MKMDRSLFLLMTGAIAGTSAAACVLKVQDANSPATAPSASAANATPTTPTAAPSATPAPTGDPNARQIGRNLKQVRGIGGLDQPTQAADGGAPTPPPAPPAPTTQCLDSAATTAAACSPMKDTSCSWASKRCDAYNKYLQPKVAAQAVACTTAATDACGAKSAVACGQKAMAASCSDATAATVCAQLAPACGATADQCTSILSALNAAGRQQALSYCSVEGGAACKSIGLAACVDQALFPAAEGGATGGGVPKK